MARVHSLHCPHHLSRKIFGYSDEMVQRRLLSPSYTNASCCTCRSVICPGSSWCEKCADADSLLSRLKVVLVFFSFSVANKCCFPHVANIKCLAAELISSTATVGVPLEPCHVFFICKPHFIKNTFTWHATLNPHFYFSLPTSRVLVYNVTSE